MEIKRQKRIAVINDFSGFGRCSVTVSLPIISAVGIQCCVLPTAIFSNHTGYEDYFFDDYTDKMEMYFSKWKKLGLEFDGIYTGFLGSARQIEIVKKFISEFKTENTKIITDPVMGDDGKLYSTYTKKICAAMGQLCKSADIITPNLTEACFLTDSRYVPGEYNRESLTQMAQKLCVGNVKKVVITGVAYKDEIANFLYEKDENEISICTVGGLRVGSERAGTGDVFSSVIAADCVNGVDFKESVLRAGRFIAKATKLSDEMNVPQQDGICFELFLKEL
ncbi:MAG: pyridoxamine kinase [Acutalibacteraceae bacterium]